MVRIDAGANATGRVAVTYRRPLTETHVLRVTVDA
jgi:hypothetical protein